MPLFDSGLMSSLSGEFALDSPSSYIQPLSQPQMNMDYSSSPLFPQVDASSFDSFMPQQQQASAQKPSLLHTIVQAAFVGMANSANASNWAEGLGMGFTGYQKYQKEQEQYQFQMEQQRQESERRKELHDMNMSKLLTEQEKLRAELDFLPEEQRMAIAADERDNLKTLASIAGSGVTYYNEIADTQEAKDAFLKNYGDLSGGRIDFYPTLDPDDNNVIPVYRLGEEGVIPAGTPIKVVNPDGTPGTMPAPSNISARDAMSLYINTARDYTDKYLGQLRYDSEKEQTEIMRQRLENEMSGGGGKGGDLNDVEGRAITMQNSVVTEARSDIDKAQDRIQSLQSQLTDYYPEALDPNTDKNDLAPQASSILEQIKTQNQLIQSKMAEINGASRRAAELLNDMPLPTVGTQVPWGRVIGYSDKLMLIEDPKTKSIIRYDPQLKKRIN